LQVPAGGQWSAAVEHADVVEAEEPALEDVVAGAILAVHPPREVEQQLLEGALQPVGVALSVPHLLQAVGEDGRPCMHGRVDVAEVPLVGGKLSTGVKI